MPPVPGLQATVEHVVTTADTALAVGSGDVAVLATPRLLALAEAATVAAVRGDLDAGTTTVGTAVTLAHTRATPVGGRVRVMAELSAVEGRALRFVVRAYDGTGALVGEGEVVRAVVDRGRFVARMEELARSEPGRAQSSRPYATRDTPSTGDQSRSGSRENPSRS
jgi:predicted thioesterase